MFSFVHIGWNGHHQHNIEQITEKGKYTLVRWQNPSTHGVKFHVIVLFSLWQQPTEIKYTKVASAIDLKKQQFFSSKERPELDPVLSALIGEDVKKSIDAKRSSEIDYIPTTSNPILTTSKSLRRNGAADDTVVVDSIAGSSSEKKQVHISKWLKQNYSDQKNIYTFRAWNDICIDFNSRNGNCREIERKKERVRQRLENEII